MTNQTVPLRQIYREVLRQHPVLVMLLIALQFLVPLIRPSQWTDFIAPHYLAFFTHLGQIIILGLSLGIYTVLGATVRRACADSMTAMAVRMSFMTVLLYLMAWGLPLALSSIAGFSLLLSPTGVLLLDHTRLGARLFWLGIATLIEAPVQAATYALLTLLITCTALFRCRMMDCFSVAVAGLVRSGITWATLGALAVLQIIALMAQWKTWPGPATPLETTQLGLLCLLYGVLVIPELCLVLFLMQHFWHAFADTPSEPPPILDPAYEPDTTA